MADKTIKLDPELAQLVADVSGLAPLVAADAARMERAQAEKAQVDAALLARVLALCRDALPAVAQRRADGARGLELIPGKPETWVSEAGEVPAGIAAVVKRHNIKTMLRTLADLLDSQNRDKVAVKYEAHSARVRAILLLLG